MYLGGDTDPPAEYAFLPLDGWAASPADAAERCSSLSTARTQRMGEAATCSTRWSSRSTSTTTTTTRSSPRSTSSSLTASTGEIVRDILRELDVDLTPEIAEALYVALVTDTGRFQYTNTSPKALRLAAELVEAGVDVHRVFQGIYESVEFAKLKPRTGPRTRGDPRGRPARHLAPQADGLHRPRRGGGVRGRHHRLPARRGRHGHGGGHPRAARASGREARVSLRASHDELDVSAIARARGAAAIARRPASRAPNGRRDRGVHPAGVRSCLPERLARRASSSSTSRRGRRPSPSSSGFATAREHGPGMRGRSTRSRRGCCSPCSARRRASRSTSSGSTSGT